MKRDQLFERGERVVREFCAINSLTVPAIAAFNSADWHWSACAFYRPTLGIQICVPRCAWIGTAGRAWSFPGYTVDRTPYGVLAHELGHHADVQKGLVPDSLLHRAYWSDFSKKVREASGEKQISSYAPNDAEWFAEMFRVYVTNPDLLRLVRPRTHRELQGVFRPVFSDTWRERLEGAPTRTIKAAERHIERARA